MSGDRLTEIEARGWAAKSFARLEYPSTPEEARGDTALIRGLAADVLALVEIAKAARVLLDEYEDEETEHGFPFNFALRDAHRSLRSRLARLDGGATEGDA